MLGAFAVQTLLMSNQFLDEMKLLYDVKTLLKAESKHNENCFI
jgi:ABC-type microcin C transport system permease subunit YejB